ncbi:glycosyltransferase [Aureisphaera galaxeae]|uniref:glycosyltransferase n=1 Tax=Aureisphaera galaxeae TaxID=1538023 RepID=UPI0023500F6E|nr:glycosyltransferase [Aureisphaera galaxeae]MDC8006309.1 glycosyltransferase [Aureisphaera galaxeae]
MKVLQLIDSLEAGGAERVAVSLANALSREIDKSYLCATRKEGLLKSSLHEDVGYLFLSRKRTVDPSAVLRLRSFIKRNGIDVVHAHSTSFFLATQLKMVYPKFRLVWHTHYGNRVTTTREQNKPLYYSSRYFESIVAVNEPLRDWCLKTLKTQNVHYLPNFVPAEKVVQGPISEREKQVICVANLKEPKNHMNLLKAFKKVHVQFPDWKLLLVGKDFEDEYSTELNNYLDANDLNPAVQKLGQRDDVATLLSTAAIGVLSSDHEGLPMALLEYGAAGLAVITTNVGQCAEVLNGNGRVVFTNDSDTLATALIAYISDENMRKTKAESFRQHISENYTTKAVIPKLLAMY